MGFLLPLFRNWPSNWFAESEKASPGSPKSGDVAFSPVSNECRINPLGSQPLWIGRFMLLSPDISDRGSAHTRYSGHQVVFARYIIAQDFGHVPAFLSCVLKVVC